MFITERKKEFADTFYRALVNNLLILTALPEMLAKQLKVTKFVNG